LGGNTNVTNINDERNAAKRAEAVLNSLVPSSPRTNAQLDTLRQTADIANAAIMQNNFSSQTDLNAKRGEAATALRGVSGSWASGRPLTQDLLSRARIAVEAWLSSLTSVRKQRPGADVG
jgi:Tfp pilus assembly protein PilN